MADWNHKRMEEKLDNMQAQRDEAQRKVVACEAQVDELAKITNRLLAASELVLSSFGYAPGRGPEWYEATRLAVESAKEKL